VVIVNFGYRVESKGGIGMRTIVIMKGATGVMIRMPSSLMHNGSTMSAIGTSDAHQSQSRRVGAEESPLDRTADSVAARARGFRHVAN
jgi:hypothetical protein